MLQHDPPSEALQDEAQKTVHCLLCEHSVTVQVCVRAYVGARACALPGVQAWVRVVADLPMMSNWHMSM